MLITRDQIKAVTDSLTESYKNLWSGLHSSYLADQIERSKASNMKELAEEVREFARSSFSGGGMSARATRRAFAAIGHEEACNPNWI